MSRPIFVHTQNTTFKYQVSTTSGLGIEPQPTDVVFIAHASQTYTKTGLMGWEFDLCLSREELTFSLPTQFKRAFTRKSDFALTLLLVLVLFSRQTKQSTIEKLWLSTVTWEQSRQCEECLFDESRFFVLSSFFTRSTGFASLYIHSNCLPVCGQ